MKASVSVDLQEVIVSALMKDSYLFSVCKDTIKDEDFSSPSCKMIYRALQFYYNKYRNLPSLSELIVTLESVYSPASGINLSEIKDVCERIYEFDKPEENFIKEKITHFIRRSRSSEVLSNFIKDFKADSDFSPEDTVNKLVKSLEVQLSTTKVFSMNDEEQIKEAREAAVGSIGQSSIIKSYINSLNKSLMFGGWQPSTVNMVVAPPGCFVGETKILTPEGSRTIESLYKSQSKVSIYGSCQEEIEEGSYSEVYLSSYEDRLVEVTFECSAFEDSLTGQSTIRCTLDHPFLTTSGEYKKAESLRIGDKVEGVTTIRFCEGMLRSVVQVIDFKIVTLEKKVPVYGLVDAKPFGNYAIALNNREGIFVSNTGKSMYLINEGVNAAKQGFDVLHIFIGDMVEYDGFIRYLSCISGTPQNNLVMMPTSKQHDVVTFCNQQYDNIFDHLFILAYPSLALTVDSLIEDINKFERSLNKDFGMIIIDYPDNLIQSGVSLYSDGGTLYSSLERMARLTKSVVLVASQPQKAYWSSSIIPLEGAAESSKKQQCVDVMLTMNTEYRGAPFGTMLLAKARKGEVGKIFRFKTDYARARMEEIDEATFNATKAASAMGR